ncbi:LysR family transcriptional regulator [Porticoccus sp. GXU_MW_L64]
MRHSYQSFTTVEELYSSVQHHISLFSLYVIIHEINKSKGGVMRLGRLDLNLFVVFDAVYRERSVTKVAQTLNLTQPAVSNALSRLREMFDDPLFVRTSEGMMPTPVADTVVGDVKSALALLEKSAGINAHFSPESAEKLYRLSMNDLAESLFLSPLYAELKKRAPKMSLSSYYIDRQSATADLKSAAIDFLVDTPLVRAKEFHFQEVIKLPYVCAVRQGHPLASKKLTLDRYIESEHIHVSSRRKGRGQADVAVNKMGLQRNIGMRVKDYLVAARVTRTTDLVWTAPKVLAESLPLVVKPLPFDVEPLELILYWHKSADTDPANQWFRDLFISATRGMGDSL